MNINGHYVDIALEVLKTRGLRVTKTRRLVVELLDQSGVALSITEIKDYLEKNGEKIDRVSIYRIVDCLEDCHLIHRLLTNGKVMKCRLSENNQDHGHHDCAGHSSATAILEKAPCHHLIICEGCGQVEEIHEPDLRTIIADVEQEARFKVRNHYLEFSGLCPACLTSCPERLRPIRPVETE